MYNNIGKKIKLLAKINAWIGIVISLIIGIYFIYWDGVNNNFALLWLAFLIMIAGSLLSWIGSWVLYGFGELIDKTTEISKNTANGFSSEPVQTNKFEDISSGKYMYGWDDDDFDDDDEEDD